MQKPANNCLAKCDDTPNVSETFANLSISEISENQLSRLASFIISRDVKVDANKVLGRIIFSCALTYQVIKRRSDT